MPMSQSASSSPTPRSTSRVMMTGLIGPDLRREDCWSGPSHDDWRKACLLESCRWNPAEKLGISHGRSSKDGYHILSRAAHDFAGLSALENLRIIVTLGAASGCRLASTRCPIAEPAVGRASSRPIPLAAYPL